MRRMPVDNSLRHMFVQYKMVKACVHRSLEIAKICRPYQLKSKYHAQNRNLLVVSVNVGVASDLECSINADT
jgi:hypothetical protein